MFFAVQRPLSPSRLTSPCLAQTPAKVLTCFIIHCCMQFCILGFYSLPQHCDYFTLMFWRKIICASVFSKAAACTDTEEMHFLLLNSQTFLLSVMRTVTLWFCPAGFRCLMRQEDEWLRSSGPSHLEASPQPSIRKSLNVHVSDASFLQAAVSQTKAVFTS